MKPASRVSSPRALSGFLLLPLILPDAASIDGYAFWGCTGLASVSLPEAASIGRFAFAATGEQALTVTLGTAVPALGNRMFHEANFKFVTVRVPSGAEAWTGKTGIFTRFTGSDTADNWGNGFRGGGRDGSGMTSRSAVNSYVSLKVTTY